MVRQHTTTPLAVGEVFNSLYDCHQLIREQLIDYVRASVVHAGGITHLRKIAHFAEPYHVRTGCHGAADLSPVSMAAALHYGLATHNAAMQETATTARRRSRSSRAPGPSPTVTSIPVRRRGWAWTSTRNSPRSTSTSAATCR